MLTNNHYQLNIEKWALLCEPKNIKNYKHSYVYDIQYMYVWIWAS